MFENFLKSNLTTNYNVSLLNPKNEDYLLLEHCERNIIAFFEFIRSSKNIFVLQGFMGCGKTVLLNYLQKLFEADTLCLHADCFLKTSLDDILLQLYSQYKNAEVKMALKQVKIHTKIFREKICAYLKSINIPITIVFDSFENIFENDNKDEIINFINETSKNSKIKIIISTRFFDGADFNDEELELSKISPLSKNEIQQNMKSLNLDTNGKVFEDFYNMTKGHYLYYTISLELTNIFSISYVDLIRDFERKKLNYEEFLFSKLLTLIPQTYNELIWSLTLLNTSCNEKMISKLCLLKNDELKYLKKIHVLYKTADEFYIKDYFKSEIKRQMDEYIKIKLHKKLRDYYTTQLPLKPSERDVPLSRATLRDEITYHNSFVENLLKSLPTKKMLGFKQNITYKDYVNPDITPLDEIKVDINHSNTEQILDENKPIELDTDNVQLTPDEIALLSEKDEAISVTTDLEENSVDLSDYFSELSDNLKVEQVELNDLTTDKLIELAEQKERNYEFLEAAEYLKKIVDKEKNDEKKYLAMTKLAVNQQKSNNFEYAIELFEKVCEFYQNKNELNKSMYMLLNIAQINKDLYKFEIAKKVYDEILQIPVEKPESLICRIKIDLAEIADYSSNYELSKCLYDEALACSLKTEDFVLQAEAYFKLALAFDYDNDISSAIRNYQACLNLSVKIVDNQYVSSSYANLATIYAENDKIDDAIEFYHCALAIDERLNNLEGQYFIYTKLGDLYKSNNKTTAQTMMMKALFLAKQLKDDFCIASSHLELGDFYYNLNKNELALKSYLYAQKYTNKSGSKENISRISDRIHDIKVRCGKEKFKEILENIKNHVKK